MPYDYRAAIESTERVLQRRAKLFRAHVISVGLFVVSIGVLAAVYRPTLLILWLLVVPLVGAFFVGDAALIRRWRFELLDAWTRGEIDFTAFRHAIKAHPQLPPATLDALLATLPAAESLRAEQRMARSARDATAAEVVARGRRDDTVLLVKVAGAALVSLLLAAAILGR